MCKTRAQLFTAGNKQEHCLSESCHFLLKVLSHRRVPEFSSASSSLFVCTTDSSPVYRTNVHVLVSHLEKHSHLAFELQSSLLVSKFAISFLESLTVLADIAELIILGNCFH